MAHKADPVKDNSCGTTVTKPHPRWGFWMTILQYMFLFKKKNFLKIKTLNDFTESKMCLYFKFTLSENLFCLLRLNLQRAHKNFRWSNALALCFRLSFFEKINFTVIALTCRSDAFRNTKVFQSQFYFFKATSFTLLAALLTTCSPNLSNFV